MDRAYKFRIYPTRSQEKVMDTHRWVAKNLWNEMLAFCKNTYEKTGKFPNRNQLQIMAKQKGMYSQSSQDISHRLIKSLWTFIQLRKKGKKIGFPRFKNIDRSKSIYYPQSGFWLGKKLKVTPFGEIKIVKHRGIEGTIKTLSLKRESAGRWYAVFISEIPDTEFRSNGKGQVGIDLGLKTFATLSNGTKINNPRHVKKYEDKLSFLQRGLSNKKKGSRNRWKQKQKVARLHEKVSNTRADFQHKLSHQLVNSYSLIALEKLQPHDMAQQRYGKQINDAGWGMFANMMTYKAESAGCQVVFVNPENTSKTCHVCGNIQNMPLNERIYFCESCHTETDRDINASINILAKATVGHTGSNASGDGKNVI
jgi:putative transposase